MKPYQICIVGGGCSAVLLLHRLVSIAQSPLSICVIERSGQFAKGLAYSTENPNHLLNSNVIQMSGVVDEPNHFLSWLAKKEMKVKGTEFVSRDIYGKYLNAILFESIEEGRKKNIDIELIENEVKAIKNNNGHYKVHLTHQAIDAHKVVLAIGNFPKHYPFMETHLKNYESKIFQEPFKVNLSSIPSDAAVAISGTGLTMVDAVLSLDSNGHIGKIFAFSRSGLLSLPHLESSDVYMDSVPKILPSKHLLQVHRQVHYLLKNSNLPWQKVIDTVRSEFQKLWLELSHFSKKQFFRHVMSNWLRSRHRIAPQNFKRLSELITSGQLEIRGGRNIKILAQSSELQLCSEKETIRVDYLINCIGLNQHVSTIQDELIQQLLQNNLVELDELKMGFRVSYNGEILDSETNIRKGMYAVGPLLKATFGEATAVSEIRQQVKNLASQLLTG